MIFLFSNTNKITLETSDLHINHQTSILKCIIHEINKSYSSQYHKLQYYSNYVICFLINHLLVLHFTFYANYFFNYN